MPGGEPHTSNERLIIILFLVALLPIALCHLLGLAQILLAPDDLLLGLILLLAMGMGVNSTLAAYSLVHYIQEREFRDLALLLIVLDGIILMLFYLITNPASASWSLFADRERNRTIITAFAFVLIPFLLFGSLEKRSTATRKQVVASTTWGVGIMPSMLVWFFLSPEPVFITSQNGGGISGITPLGWVILLGALITIVGSLVKSFFAWYREKTRITLAYFLALVLWMTSVLTFVVQADPFQLSELLWFWGFSSGFAVLAVAMLISNVIEPRKDLSEAVRSRTEDLEYAKKETEFYLNIWAHKVGNLLQGMTTYLDLFSASIDPEFLSRPQETAKDLSGQATMINKQVAALLRVKENEEPRTWPVHLSNMVRKAYEETTEALGRKSEALVLDGESKVHVIADDFLDLVFNCLFRFILGNHLSGNPFKLKIEESKDKVQVCITCPGMTLTRDAELALSDDIIPDRKHLGLEIFTAKILMTYYGGHLAYRKDSDTDVISFILDFKQFRK